MKLLAVIALLVCAGPALAQTKTFYISPLGSDSNNGRSLATAWQTISKANTNTTNNTEVAHTNFGGADSNVVFLLHTDEAAGSPYLGTAAYATFPLPEGTATGGKRWIYQFAGNVDYRGAGPGVSCPGGDITKAYVTYRGLSFNSTPSLRNGSVFDTLDRCTSAGVLSGLEAKNSKYCVVDNCDFKGFYFQVCADQLAVEQVNVLKVNNCTFYNLGLAQPTSSPIKISNCDSCEFTRNRGKITHPTGEGVQAYYLAYSQYAVLKYNHWEFENNSTGGSAYERFCFWRDSLQNLTWKCDTLIGYGSAPTKLLVSAAGHYPGTCHTYTMDSLVIKVNDVALWPQGGLWNWTMTNSVIVSETGNALYCSGVTLKGDNIFDHNTFASGFVGHYSTPSGSCPNGAVKNTDVSGIINMDGANLVPVGGTDSTQWTNNIVASLLPAKTGEANYLCDRTYPLQVFLVGQSNKWTSAWNLYYNKVQKTATGDKTIAWTNSSEGTLAQYKVAFSGLEANSVFGTPRFGSIGGDSTFTNFVPDLNPSSDSSWAKGRGKDGTDIGARQSPPIAWQVRTGATFLGDSAISYTDSLIIRNVGTGTLRLETPTVVGAATGCSAILSSSSVAASSNQWVVVTVVGPSSQPAGWHVLVRTNDPVQPTLDYTIAWNGAVESLRTVGGHGRGTIPAGP